MIIEQQKIVQPKRHHKTGSRLRSFAKNKLLRISLATAIVLYAINSLVIYGINKVTYERELAFLNETQTEALNALKRNAESPFDENFRPLERPSPFREIDAFDADAMHWSNIFCQYTAGVLVFDANGDEKLDVYFCQDGRNWTRPTDENGVLLDKPRLQHNALYINQGNDIAGNPVFVQVSKLVEKNDTYQKAELLVENYLFPRNNPSDSQERIGRQSNLAVAADFNNDGLLDLLVGNGLPGMLWSHPKTQRVLPQVTSPVGRQARRSKLPLAGQGMFFIDKYEVGDNTYDRCESSRGLEYYGANSLFLNMGDKDRDGIPEWKDVSRDVELEGQRNTYSLCVADIDLDGDLDLFEGNVMDFDFWPGGAKGWAGAANQLYINQLAETGQLKFVERAAEMDVDGVYDEENPMPYYYKLRKIPFLPVEYSLLFFRFIKYLPDYLVINGQEAEHGQISWATVIQDVNDDGYPDIWVANDMSNLRLYINEEGKKFREEKHVRSEATGNWMSFAAGDYNRDLKEDLFAGNFGGAITSFAFTAPDPMEDFDPVISIATSFQIAFGDDEFHNRHNTFHAVIDGANYNKELPSKVKHSKILPPDASLPNNMRRAAPDRVWKPPVFDANGLDPYEFTWGCTNFDIQNDGNVDFYYLGCLYGRGGGLFLIMGTSPGRLLVNVTTEEDGAALRFTDLTAEHHLFNIEELMYDRLESEGYVYRKSPLQNWGKRDMVYSYDRSSWSVQGPGIQEKVTNHDLIQASENGRAVITADLNNDGFADLIMRNAGGYDSRSSKSVNLKARIDGRIKVLPAHDYNYPTLTNYEPGRSRLFINTYRENNWIKVHLIDDSKESFNRDAVGAKVVINEKYLRVKRSGQGGFISNKFEDLQFGLGDESATIIKIYWPDKAREVAQYDLESLKRGTLTISKTRGIVNWKPRK